MSEIYKAGSPEKDRIIKQSPNNSKQLSVFERKLIQVQEEVDSLKAQAVQEADGIIAKANAEADAIRSKAYREGVDKGKGEAITLIEELADTLRKRIDGLEEIQVEFLKKSRGQLVDFSFKLAKLIIGEEVRSNPVFVEKQLERIFERLSIEGKVEIFVSTEDFETIETYMRETGGGLARNGYEIKVDSTLGRGGVRVDTPTMGVDGSIDGMCQRVEAVVRDLLSDDG